MAKKKEEIKKVTFEIKEGEYKGKYAVKRAKLNIPKVGIVNASELVEMPDVLEHLVKIGSGTIQKIGEVAEKPKNQDSPELVAARKEFEELSDQKAGNKTLETLQKEIETLKGKE